MLMFCANTPHKVYHEVKTSLDIPILHIADATTESIQEEGLKKVCFLGTKYSMTEDFVTQRIADNGIEVFPPKKDEIVEELHRIIYKLIITLCIGLIVIISIAEYVDNILTTLIQTVDASTFLHL